MEMDIQKAGDNSTQIQASVINVYGISEERAREICKEEFGKIKELTQEAEQTAFQRVCELENRVVPKFSQIDKGLDFFSNPDFLFLLIEAQKSAARSERPADYDLLSELLLHRVKNDSDMETRLGIKKAVEIVDSISDDALLGLTLFYLVTSCTPPTGEIDSGLDMLDSLFEKIIHGNLPHGYLWLDHLDILKTIRLNQFGKFQPIIDYYSSSLDGYVCTGIPKDSIDYNNAVNILASINVSKDFLVDNVLCPGYVRLNIPKQSSYKSISSVISSYLTIPLSDKEATSLKQIISLYDKNPNLINAVKQRFSEKWEKRKTLSLLKKWWEDIPTSLTITKVGKVLAHANAQIYDSSIPSLD